MKRLMIAMLAVGLAATAFLVSAQASTPKLVGKVGPDFSITLKKGTTKVKTLKAGKYLFVISDKASIHNFTIEREKGGPKIEKTLKKGTWKYYCSVHESLMFGFFKVTS